MARSADQMGITFDEVLGSNGSDRSGNLLKLEFVFLPSDACQLYHWTTLAMMADIRVTMR